MKNLVANGKTWCAAHPHFIKMSLWFFTATILLLAFSHCVYAADPSGTDLLAPAKAEIATTFGKGSVVWFILYLAEIITAIVAYIKSKNFMVFVGLAGVLIFTTVGWMLISP